MPENASKTGPGRGFATLVYLQFLKISLYTRGSGLFLNKSLPYPELLTRVSRLCPGVHSLRHPVISLLSCNTLFVRQT